MFTSNLIRLSFFHHKPTVSTILCYKMSMLLSCFNNVSSKETFLHVTCKRQFLEWSFDFENCDLLIRGMEYMTTTYHRYTISTNTDISQVMDTIEHRYRKVENKIFLVL